MEQKLKPLLMELSLCAGAIIGSGLCLYLWLPVWAEGQHLKQQAVITQKETEAVRRFAASYAHSQETYAEALASMQEKLQAEEAVLPREEDLDRENTLTEIQKNAEEAGAKLEGAKWGKAKKLAKGRAALPLEVALQGEYGALMKTVSALETGKEGLSLARFDTLRLSKGQRGLEAKGTLLFFVREKKKGSASVADT